LGKGRITYIGALLDPALMTAAVQWMAKSAGLLPVFGPVPDGVEVCRRGRVFILLNHTKQPRTVALPRPSRDLLAGTELRGSLTLPAQGVTLISVTGYAIPNLLISEVAPTCWRIAVDEHWRC
jgi:beta-galactosidase